MPINKGYRQSRTGSQRTILCDSVSSVLIFVFFFTLFFSHNVRIINRINTCFLYAATTIRRSDTKFSAIIIAINRKCSVLHSAYVLSCNGSYIVLRGRWCNIIVLNVHEPSEDKSDDLKDRFTRKWSRFLTVFLGII